MSILTGFIKTKRHRKTDAGYILQSEWTHSDTVEMPDGKTLTEAMSDTEAANKMIKGVIDGTTPIGNSFKLGGLTPTEWQGKIDDAVGEVNKRVDDIVDGALVVGNSEKFGGLSVEEWEDKIGNSGGGSSVDVSALQSAIDGIVDGTTPSGDSKKLDGHEASYFAKADTVLKFENVSVATDLWVEDTTDATFPYKADVVCDGVTEEYVPFVNFTIEDANSGNYSVICESGDGIVSIWAKEAPTEELIIDNILCVKGGV